MPHSNRVIPSPNRILIPRKQRELNTIDLYQLSPLFNVVGKAGPVCSLIINSEVMVAAAKMVEVCSYVVIFGWVVLWVNVAVAVAEVVAVVPYGWVVLWVDEVAVAEVVAVVAYGWVVLWVDEVVAVA